MNAANLNAQEAPTSRWLPALYGRWATVLIVTTVFSHDQKRSSGTPGCFCDKDLGHLSALARIGAAAPSLSATGGTTHFQEKS